MRKIIILKHKLSFLFICLCCTLLLSSCSETYEKEDISEYVRNVLGITNFTVSSKPEIYEDEEGYKDEVWTIQDLNNKIVFHVIDDHRWSGQRAVNSLINDYDFAVFNHIQADLTQVEHLELVSQQDDSGSFVGNIIGSFSNSEELEACYNELIELKDSFTTLGYDGLGIWFELEYNHPMRNPIPDYIDTSGDISGRTDHDFTYEEMQYKMIQTDLDYRYESINSLSKEEIDEALTGYFGKIGIYTGTKLEQDDYEDSLILYYDDIIANNGISFSSLYEIVSREGFDVQGDQWHYTFVGVDGVVYEISYDFTTDAYIEGAGDVYDFEFEEGDIAYYYLANGEQFVMYPHDSNHFTQYEAERLTGLEFVIGYGDDA